MTQDSKIQEALNRIDTFDWYWKMSDASFESNYQNAKAGMKAFVRLVNTIADNAVREALRSLWILNYEDAVNAKNGRTTDNFETRKAELIAVIAA